MYLFSLISLILIHNVSAGYDASEIDQMTFPVFPDDYLFSSNGEKDGYECLLTYIGRKDSEDNFLCVKIGKTISNPLIHWFSDGLKPDGMKCISITEPEDKGYNQKSTLCLPTVVPLNLQWSHVGPISNAKCLKFNNAENPSWLNNYLCTETTTTEAVYPLWPNDFQWSYAGVLPGYDCLAIREPSEPSNHAWEDNYFCVKSGPGYKQVGMKWSWAGPINGMRCTNIKEPADPHHWGDNYICVPNETPYNFQYSHWGALSGVTCIQWLEPSDPHTWIDNFLCADETFSQYPSWPEDFKWSFAGPLGGYNCLPIREPSEPGNHYWNDNYFCVKTGPGLRAVEMKWSYAGPINGMRCTNIKEPSDPHHWGDNYICVANETPYDFQYTHWGALADKECIQWNEPSDPDTWSDNYLCHERTGYPKWPKDFTFSYHWQSSGRKCVQIVEPSEPASNGWDNNFFCWIQGPKMNDPMLKWSYAGKIPGMKCTQVLEPSDGHTWNDNYLCVPEGSPYSFVWSYAGGRAGLECISWNEPGDKDTWSDNYMCHQRTY